MSAHRRAWNASPTPVRRSDDGDREADVARLDRREDVLIVEEEEVFRQERAEAPPEDRVLRDVPTDLLVVGGARGEVGVALEVREQAEDRADESREDEAHADDEHGRPLEHRAAHGARKRREQHDGTDDEGEDARARLSHRFAHRDDAHLPPSGEPGVFGVGEGEDERERQHHREHDAELDRMHRGAGNAHQVGVDVGAAGEVHLGVLAECRDELEERRHEVLLGDVLEDADDREECSRVDETAKEHPESIEGDHAVGDQERGADQRDDVQHRGVRGGPLVAGHGCEIRRPRGSRGP